MIEIKIMKISMFPISRSSVHSQGAVPTASTIRHLYWTMCVRGSKVCCGNYMCFNYQLSV